MNKLNKRILIKLLFIPIFAFIILLIYSVSLYFINLNKLSPQVIFKIDSYQVQLMKEELLAEHEANKTIRLLFVGDVMLADFVGVSIVEEKRNPFQFMRDVFPKYDLVIANLECNISAPETGSKQPKAYAFKAPLESLRRLEYSGVDIVSLANNHTMDYGADALLEQIDLLDGINMKHFGAGKNIEEAFTPKYVEIKGYTFAFLGFNDIENIYGDATNSSPGFAFIERGREDLVINSIKEARNNSDFVIVYPHWGIERSFTVNSTQKYWAKLFIDNGADLVIGAHPHVIQSMEEYKGKMIHYSLGNFVFSGMDSPANVGEILEVVIYEGEITEFNTQKVQMTYHGFPQIID